MHTIASPNSIHMCKFNIWDFSNWGYQFYLFNFHCIVWLLPQYVVITAAEIMFSVTGLEFSYSQAPSSMKSVLQACWLLTVAFGNVIVVVIAEARIFQSQVYLLILFKVQDFFKVRNLFTGLRVLPLHGFNVRRYGNFHSLGHALQIRVSRRRQAYGGN